MKYQVDSGVEALFSLMPQNIIELMAKSLDHELGGEGEILESDYNIFRHDCLVLCLESIIDRFKPSEEIQQLVNKYGAIKTQLDLF